MLMQKLVVAVALALACSGCFTLDSSTSALLAPDADEHVIVRNYGWFLFGCVPLVCGNADVESIWGSTFFSNEVTLDVAHGVLSRHAAASGREIRDVMMLDDRQALFVPFSISYIPIPWIVQYKEVNVSATLAPKGGVR